MDIITTFVILVVAGLIHASFQLGTSMLTLLSSHTIGRKRSQARLVLLTNAFVTGVVVMTLLLVSFSALLLRPIAISASSEFLWVTVCGVLVALGMSVWLVYYQKGSGTKLWIPRTLAKFLTDRTKKTKHTAEAFSLGLTSVVAEFVFLFAPIALAGLVISMMAPPFQLIGLLTYTTVSSLSLLLVNALVGSGHSISRIQRWRESNKSFLQFAAGSGLVVLSFYVYVNQIAVTQVMALAG